MPWKRLDREMLAIIKAQVSLLRQTRRGARSRGLKEFVYAASMVATLDSFTEGSRLEGTDWEKEAGL